MPAIDSRRTGIVSSQRQGEIVMITSQHCIQISGSAIYVFARCKGVVYAHLGSSSWHQLHQPTGPGAAYGMDIAAALLPDHGCKQVGVKIVRLACCGEHFLQVDCFQRSGRSSSGCFIYNRQIDMLAGGDVSGIYFHKVCVAGGEIQPHPVADRLAMVAGQVKAIGQGDVFGCPCQT